MTNTFSQYIRGFSGAWYNPNGIIYIINPQEINKTEVGEIIIDNMFRVIKEPEIGIVYALEDTSWRVRDIEIINFPNRNVRVSDVIYFPSSGSRPIDIFRNANLRQENIRFFQKNDILARRIYSIDRVEILQEGNTDEYHEIIETLSKSRLVVFNTLPNSIKYIFNDMELFDYSERIGEDASIRTELFNENEAIIRWENYSNIDWTPNVFSLRIFYKIIFSN